MHTDDPIVAAAVAALERQEGPYSLAPAAWAQSTAPAPSSPYAARTEREQALLVVASDVAAAVLEAAARVREQTSVWDRHGPQYLRGRAQHARRLSCPR